MATTTNIVRQNELLNSLPLKLITPEGMSTQHATHLVAHESNGEIYLFFFEAPPPPRIGSPKAAAEKLANFNNLSATCIARIVVNKARWPQFLDILQKCTDTEIQYERKEICVPTLPTRVKITPVASQPGSLLNAKEARKLLGVSDRTLYTLVKSGELVAIKIGKLVRFRPEDIDTFIQKQRGARGHSDNAPLAANRQKAPEQNMKGAEHIKSVRPKKHRPHQPSLSRSASTLNKPIASGNKSQAEQAKQALTPFELLLREINVDRANLPSITNGELLRIAEVDILTLHGWMYLNRSLPEEARNKLKQHFSKYLST